MLLLFLCLFFYCELLKCSELETANTNRSLRKDDEHLSRKYENILHYPNVFLYNTPIILRNLPSNLSPFPKNFTKPILPDVYHKTSEEPTTTTVSVPSTPSTLPREIIYPTYESISNITSPSGPVEETLPFTIYPPGFEPGSITVGTIPTVDPSAAEYAKKWLQEIAKSTTVSSKAVVPKLSQVFDYNYSNEGFLLPIRRNQNTTQRRTSHKQLKNSTHRHQTQPIKHQTAITPQIIKKRNSGSEVEAFWHNPPKLMAPSVPTTRCLLQTNQNVTKQRLKPGLLLGKASLTDVVWNPEYIEESEKTTPGSYDVKKILRMNEKPARPAKLNEKPAKLNEKPAKMKNDSKNSTDMDLDLLTADPAYYLQFVRHKLYPELPSTTSKIVKMKEIRHKTYMTVFVMELTRLVAIKEKTAVHDVVKHTDPIVHSLHKNRQLHWLLKPLVDTIKKIATLLKNSNITVIQDLAGKVHETLKQRREKLSEEVNGILEFVNRLYDEEDGGHLLESLRDFAAFPNVTLSGYWLCNSLINNFLRPFRRLHDPRQRHHLMETVKQALRTGSGSSSSDGTTAPSSSVVIPVNGTSNITDAALNQTALCITRRPKRHRKKKHKRTNRQKRQKTRLRLPDCS